MLKPYKRGAAEVDRIIRSAEEQIKAVTNEPILLRAYEPPFRLEAIMLAVCDKLQVSEADVTGPSRKENIKDARHIASYIARGTGHYSNSEIARWLNYDDHTGVTHACKRVNNLLDIGDPLIAYKVDICKSTLYNQIPLNDNL